MIVSMLQDHGTQAIASTVMANIGDEFVVDKSNRRMVGGLVNNGIGGQLEVIDRL